MLVNLHHQVEEMNTQEMGKTEGRCFLVGLVIGAVVTATYLLVTKNGGKDPDCPSDCEC